MALPSGLGVSSRLYDCRPCGFRAWAVDERKVGAASLAGMRVAVHPCPRCGRRSGTAMTWLLAWSALVGLFVGAMTLMTTRNALLSAAVVLAISLLTWRVTHPRRRAIRFLDSSRAERENERV